MGTSDVSVIIPCYECLKTIERTIRSILCQSLPPKEVIIVDDASEDFENLKQQVELLRMQFKDKHISFIFYQHKFNTGPGVARNTAWELATAKYLAFLDADDTWHPDKLMVQYNYMERNPDVVMSSTQSKIINNQVDKENSTEVIFTHVNKYTLLFKNIIKTRTVMMKRDVTQRFDTAKRFSEDYDLWLRLAYSGSILKHSKSILAYEYKHPYLGNGMSSRLWEMEKGEINSIWKLRNANILATFLHIPAIIFSFGKFLRRLLISILISRNSSAN